MANQVNHWLQKQLSVIQQPITSFEEAFASGRLFLEVLRSVQLLSDDEDVSLPEPVKYLPSSSAARMVTFRVVANALAVANISIDGRTIKDIVTEQRGAAMAVLLQIKNSVEGASAKRSRLEAKRAARATAGSTVRDATAMGTRERVRAAQSSLNTVQRALMAGVPRKHVMLLARLQKFEDRRVAAEASADAVASRAVLVQQDSAGVLREAMQATRRVKREWLTQHLAQGERAWAENQRRFLEREQEQLSFELGMAKRQQVLAHNATVAATTEARTGIEGFHATLHKLGISDGGEAEEPAIAAEPLAGGGGGGGAGASGTAALGTTVDAGRMRRLRTAAATAAAGPINMATPVEVYGAATMAAANPVAIPSRDAVLAALDPPSLADTAPLAHETGLINASRRADSTYDFTTGEGTMGPRGGLSSTWAHREELPHEYLARMEHKVADEWSHRDVDEFRANLKERTTQNAKARRERATRGRMQAAAQREAQSKLSLDAHIESLVADFAEQGGSVSQAARKQWQARTMKARRLAQAAAWAADQDAKRAEVTVTALELSAAAAAEARATRKTQMQSVYEGRRQATAARASMEAAFAAEVAHDAVSMLMHVLDAVLPWMEETEMTRTGMARRGVPPKVFRQMKREFVSGTIAARAQSIARETALASALADNSQGSDDDSVSSPRSPVPKGPSVQTGRPVVRYSRDPLVKGGGRRTAWGVVLDGHIVGRTSLAAAATGKLQRVAYLDATGDAHGPQRPLLLRSMAPPHPSFMGGGHDPLTHLLLQSAAVAPQPSVPGSASALLQALLHACGSAAPPNTPWAESALGGWHVSAGTHLPTWVATNWKQHTEGTMGLPRMLASLVASRPSTGARGEGGGSMSGGAVHALLSSDSHADGVTVLPGAPPLPLVGQQHPPAAGRAAPLTKLMSVLGLDNMQTEALSRAVGGALGLPVLAPHDIMQVALVVSKVFGIAHVFAAGVAADMAAARAAALTKAQAKHTAAAGAAVAATASSDKKSKGAAKARAHGEHESWAQKWANIPAHSLPPSLASAVLTAVAQVVAESLPQQRAVQASIAALVKTLPEELQSIAQHCERSALSVAMAAIGAAPPLQHSSAPPSTSAASSVSQESPPMHFCGVLGSAEANAAGEGGPISSMEGGPISGRDGGLLSPSSQGTRRELSMASAVSSVQPWDEGWGAGHGSSLHSLRSNEGRAFSPTAAPHWASGPGVQWNEWAADDALYALGTVAQLVAVRPAPVESADASDSKGVTEQGGEGGGSLKHPCSIPHAVAHASYLVQRRRAAVRWAHVPRDSAAFEDLVAAAAGASSAPDTPKRSKGKKAPKGGAGALEDELGADGVPGLPPAVSTIISAAWTELGAGSGGGIALPAVMLLRNSEVFLAAFGVVLRRCKAAWGDLVPGWQCGAVLVNMPHSHAEHAMAQIVHSSALAGCTMLRLRPALGEGSTLDDGAMGAMPGICARVEGTRIVAASGAVIPPTLAQVTAPEGGAVDAATVDDLSADDVDVAARAPFDMARLGGGCPIVPWLPPAADLGGDPPLTGDGDVPSLSSHALPAWVRFGVAPPLDSLTGEPAPPLGLLPDGVSWAAGEADIEGPYTPSDAITAEWWMNCLSGCVVRKASTEGGAGGPWGQHGVPALCIEPRDSPPTADDGSDKQYPQLPSAGGVAAALLAQDPPALLGVVNAQVASSARGGGQRHEPGLHVGTAVSVGAAAVVPPSPPLDDATGLDSPGASPTSTPREVTERTYSSEGGQEGVAAPLTVASPVASHAAGMPLCMQVRPLHVRLPASLPVNVWPWEVDTSAVSLEDDVAPAQAGAKGSKGPSSSLKSGRGASASTSSPAEALAHISAACLPLESTGAPHGLPLSELRLAQRLLATQGALTAREQMLRSQAADEGSDSLSEAISSGRPPLNLLADAMLEGGAGGSKSGKKSKGSSPDIEPLLRGAIDIGVEVTPTASDTADVVMPSPAQLVQWAHHAEMWAHEWHEACTAHMHAIREDRQQDGDSSDSKGDAGDSKDAHSASSVLSAPARFRGAITAWHVLPLLNLLKGIHGGYGNISAIDRCVLAPGAPGGGLDAVAMLDAVLGTPVVGESVGALQGAHSVDVPLVLLSASNLLAILGPLAAGAGALVTELDTTSPRTKGGKGGKGGSMSKPSKKGLSEAPEDSAGAHRGLVLRGAPVLNMSAAPADVLTACLGLVTAWEQGSVQGHLAAIAAAASVGSLMISPADTAAGASVSSKGVKGGAATSLSEAPPPFCVRLLSRSWASIAAQSGKQVQGGDTPDFKSDSKQDAAPVVGTPAHEVPVVAAALQGPSPLGALAAMTQGAATRLLVSSAVDGVNMAQHLLHSAMQHMCPAGDLGEGIAPSREVRALWGAVLQGRAPFTGIGGAPRLAMQWLSVEQAYSRLSHTLTHWSVVEEGAYAERIRGAARTFLRLLRAPHGTLSRHPFFKSIAGPRGALLPTAGGVGAAGDLRASITRARAEGTVLRRMKGGVQGGSARGGGSDAVSVVSSMTGFTAPQSTLRGGRVLAEMGGGIPAAGAPNSMTAQLKAKAYAERPSARNLAASAGPAFKPPSKPWRSSAASGGQHAGSAAGGADLPWVCIGGAENGPMDAEVGQLVPLAIAEASKWVQGGSTSSPASEGAGGYVGACTGSSADALLLGGAQTHQAAPAELLTIGTLGTDAAVTLYHGKHTVGPPAAGERRTKASGLTDCGPLHGTPAYPVDCSPGQAALYQAGRLLNALRAEQWGDAGAMGGARAAVEAAAAAAWDEAADSRDAATRLTAAFEEEWWAHLAATRREVIASLQLQAACVWVCDTLRLGLETAAALHPRLQGEATTPAQVLDAVTWAGKDAADAAAAISPRDPPMELVVGPLVASSHHLSSHSEREAGVVDDAVGILRDIVDDEDIGAVPGTILDGLEQIQHALQAATPMGAGGVCSSIEDPAMQESDGRHLTLPEAVHRAYARLAEVTMAAARRVLHWAEDWKLNAGSSVLLAFEEQGADSHVPAVPPSHGVSVAGIQAAALLVVGTWTAGHEQLRGHIEACFQAEQALCWSHCDALAAMRGWVSARTTAANAAVDAVVSRLTSYVDSGWEWAQRREGDVARQAAAAAAANIAGPAMGSDTPDAASAALDALNQTRQLLGKGIHGEELRRVDPRLQGSSLTLAVQDGIMCHFGVGTSAAPMQWPLQPGVHPSAVADGAVVAAGLGDGPSLSAAEAPQAESQSLWARMNAAGSPDSTPQEESKGSRGGSPGSNASPAKPLTSSQRALASIAKCSWGNRQALSAAMRQAQSLLGTGTPSGTHPSTWSGPTGGPDGSGAGFDDSASAAMLLSPMARGGGTAGLPTPAAARGPLHSMGRASTAASLPSAVGGGGASAVFALRNTGGHMEDEQEDVHDGPAGAAIMPHVGPLCGATLSGALCSLDSEGARELLLAAPDAGARVLLGEGGAGGGDCTCPDGVDSGADSLALGPMGTQVPLPPSAARREAAAKAKRAARQVAKQGAARRRLGGVAGAALLPSLLAAAQALGLLTPEDAAAAAGPGGGSGNEGGGDGSVARAVSASVLAAGRVLKFGRGGHAVSLRLRQELPTYVDLPRALRLTLPQLASICVQLLHPTRIAGAAMDIEGSWSQCPTTLLPRKLVSRGGLLPVGTSLSSALKRIAASTSGLQMAPDEAALQHAQKALCVVQLVACAVPCVVDWLREGILALGCAGEGKLSARPLSPQGPRPVTSLQSDVPVQGPSRLAAPCPGPWFRLASRLPEDAGQRVAAALHQAAQADSTKHSAQVVAGIPVEARMMVQLAAYLVRGGVARLARDLQRQDATAKGAMQVNVALAGGDMGAVGLATQQLPCIPSARVKPSAEALLRGAVRQFAWGGLPSRFQRPPTPEQLLAMQRSALLASAYLSPDAVDGGDDAKAKSGTGGSVAHPPSEGDDAPLQTDPVALMATATQAACKPLLLSESQWDAARLWCQVHPMEAARLAVGVSGGRSGTTETPPAPNGSADSMVACMQHDLKLQDALTRVTAPLLPASTTDPALLAAAASANTHGVQANSVVPLLSQREEELQALRTLLWALYATRDTRRRAVAMLQAAPPSKRREGGPRGSRSASERKGRKGGSRSRRSRSKGRRNGGGSDDEAGDSATDLDPSVQALLHGAQVATSSTGSGLPAAGMAMDVSALLADLIPACTAIPAAATPCSAKAGVGAGLFALPSTQLDARQLADDAAEEEGGTGILPVLFSSPRGDLPVWLQGASGEGGGAARIRAGGLFAVSLAVQRLLLVDAAVFGQLATLASAYTAGIAKYSSSAATGNAGGTDLVAPLHPLRVYMSRPPTEVLACVSALLDSPQRLLGESLMQAEAQVTTPPGVVTPDDMFLAMQAAGMQT